LRSTYPQANGQPGRDDRHVRVGPRVTVLAQFTDHDGFDGVILGHSRHPYH